MTRLEREHRFQQATIRLRRLEAEKRVTEAALERARTADHLVTVELMQARAEQLRLAESLERLAEKESA